ncbi:MAG: hypothetical protein HWD57_05985 [Candidatus Accumulibacter cognatus]|uniref:Uncharacterized protein n=1 Tax=Candidatus Accumulibacter cognatus TaxID=2954383 RepID=A0A7D5SCX7_9PROT|nr:MAG: hypothetical protein HWD57_05985 [Candidatus Accumulibacter cognatus]
MMNDAEPDDQEHADDIVEVVAYEAPMPPTAKDFLPWHRPRKQYVRHHQWCHEIARMISDTPPAGGVLKYLGLPGVDLLDLRHFHAAVCQDKSVDLRFLGFNSSARPASKANTELNVSLDEVRRLPRVDPLSDVIGDNFARVANQDSIAFRKARELGPYDVINLDLCDGFGAQAPGALDNSYYEAVRSLMALQARTMNPWLLLLTTRADKPNVNDEVLQVLLRKYISNLADCAPFREASRDFFDIETADALNAAADTPTGLLPVFLTGLCKWFVAMALEHQPPTTVELRSVFGYRVDTSAQHEDLISLALKFTPTFVPAGDPMGLANHPVAAPDEGTLATRALKRVAKRIDADKKLAEDGELHQRMIDATAHLLGLARYDVAAYKVWLQTA